MDIRQQEYMTALVREGSFNKAAKKLQISQPALSNWLSSLEAQLGTQLVIRSRNAALQLTPAGRIYYEGSLRAVAVRDRTLSDIRRLRQQPRQRILITGTPHRGMEIFTAVFAPFHRKYPSVSLEFTESYHKASLKRIMAGSSDLMIGTAFDMDFPNFRMIQTAQEEYVLFLPPAHPLGYDASGIGPDAPLPVMDPARIAGTAIVTWPQSEDETVYSLLRQAGLVSDILIYSDNFPAIYNMVKNGIGAALLPRLYFSGSDGVSIYSLKPRLFSYLGLICRNSHELSKEELYIAHLIWQKFGQPEFAGNDLFSRLYPEEV